jgi:hypothetical protein
MMLGPKLGRHKPGFRVVPIKSSFSSLSLLFLEMLDLLSDTTADDSDHFLDLLADSDDFSSFPGNLKIHSSSPGPPTRDLLESALGQPNLYNESSDYTPILDDSDSGDCSQLDGKCETAFSNATQVRNKDALAQGTILRALIDEESLKTAQ